MLRCYRLSCWTHVPALLLLQHNMLFPLLLVHLDCCRGVNLTTERLGQLIFEILADLDVNCLLYLILQIFFDDRLVQLCLILVHRCGLNRLMLCWCWFLKLRIVLTLRVLQLLNLLQKSCFHSLSKRWLHRWHYSLGFLSLLHEWLLCNVEISLQSVLVKLLGLPCLCVLAYR